VYLSTATDSRCDRVACPDAPLHGLHLPACPAWCTSPDDDGEARHLAQMRSVAVTADGGEYHVPNLFADLRQRPGDDLPLIHLDRDELLVARLRPAEAAELGVRMVELARLAGAQ
jgi:hypothetical protein